MWPFSRKKKTQVVNNDSNSILGRVSLLLRSNVNAMLDNAVEPEKMMDQIIRDYVTNMAATKEAVQETVANLRLIEAQQAQDEKSLYEWEHRAELAAAKTRELRESGDVKEAEKTEKLARRALNQQVATEQRIDQRSPNIEQNNNIVEQLKEGLQAMEERLDDLKIQRSNLMSRYQLAQTQQNFAATMGEINGSDPTSSLSQLENHVMREEANAQGSLEVASNSIHHQFEELESNSASIEAESRLESLLSGETPAKHNRQLEN